MDKGNGKEDKSESKEGKSPGPQPIYRHYRVDRDTGQVKRYQRGLPEEDRWDPDERGGYTACVLLLDGTQVLGIGVFVHDGAFCYRIGRAASYGRALKDAGLLDQVRAERKARRVAAKKEVEAEPLPF